MLISINSIDYILPSEPLFAHLKWEVNEVCDQKNLSKFDIKLSRVCQSIDADVTVLSYAPKFKSIVIDVLIFCLVIYSKLIPIGIRGLLSKFGFRINK